MTLKENQVKAKCAVNKLYRLLEQFMRAVRPKNFSCLTYHVIGNVTTQYVISEQQLSEQLMFLKAEGYVVEGFAELECRLKSNQEIPLITLSLRLMMDMKVQCVRRISLKCNAQSHFLFHAR